MNNDLISREALKKAIMYKTGVAEETWEQLYDSVLEEIDNAPTVDIKDQIAGAYNEGYACGSRENKRPQGEWTIGYTVKQKKVAVCNLCNCISFQGKTNFCHNCGAKMLKGGAI